MFGRNKNLWIDYKIFMFENKFITINQQPVIKIMFTRFKAVKYSWQEKLTFILCDICKYVCDRNSNKISKIKNSN